MSRKTSMTAAQYHVVAEGIRRIECPETRLKMADHFAKYFHGRSPGFDPQVWYEATGGLINRKVAA